MTGFLLIEGVVVTYCIITYLLASMPSPPKRRIRRGYSNPHVVSDTREAEVPPRTSRLFDSIDVDDLDDISLPHHSPSSTNELHHDQSGSADHASNNECAHHSGSSWFSHHESCSSDHHSSHESSSDSSHDSSWHDFFTGSDDGGHHHH